MIFVLGRVILPTRAENLPSLHLRLPVVITVRPPVGSGHPTLDVNTDVTVGMGPGVVITGWKRHEFPNGFLMTCHFGGNWNEIGRGW